MLSQLSELQKSDETYWMTSMSFSVETRTEDGDELVHKTYTFSWGEEFDEWHFTEYEEKRCSVESKANCRNWKKSRHVWWNEVTKSIDVDIPQKVSDKLAERLGCEEVTIQLQ